MGVPTPFHNRMSEACKSLRWKEWAGYFTPEKYDTVHDNEYHLLRQSAGFIDVSPLYKYDVRGRDAAALLDLVMVREVRKMKNFQVAYTAWCDEAGKTIDDGTITRFDEGHFRVTAAHPTLAWFTMHAHGLDVKIEDVSEKYAALAVQGPRSRAVLIDAGLGGVDRLRFFHAMRAPLDGYEVVVTRTGYTGDLGYEIWVEAPHAEKLWDRVAKAGRPHHAAPVGMLALDMARIEAGFIMIDVDYNSARHALIDEQKSSPFEIGLGWVVNLKKPHFVGRPALAEEHRKGSKWALIGLEIDWEELELLYDQLGLPPHLPTTAWRTPVPLYERHNGRQIGRATSGTWSPLLKRNLALATVESQFALLGTEMQIEVTVEFERKTVTARVVERPFFDPPRKKAMAEETSRELVGSH
jgi:aminomethyltransferase